MGEARLFQAFAAKLQNKSCNHNPALRRVMSAAMALHFPIAAAIGLFIPLTLHKLGRDPAQASSAMITAVTDWGGFFSFPSLAMRFLLLLSAYAILMHGGCSILLARHFMIL